MPPNMKLQNWNVNLSALTKEEINAIALDIEKGMTHNEVADTIKAQTGRKVVVSDRGRNHRRIIVEYYDVKWEEENAMGRYDTVVYEA